jgi:2-hydroxycyclohexanecarboxyl-CoA dehydrogenase
VNAVRAVLDPMIAQHSGSIVCMGSDSGKVGPPKQTIYASAKAAIMNFARSLSKEVGPQGIRINVVNAGMTKTPALTASGWLTPEKEAHFAKDYPLRRLGEAQEVVEAILFLASERGSFITGQTLSVSGGIA